MMQAGMNQMKDQAKSLIPNEMQDKKEGGKEGEENGKIENSENKNQVKQKKPKRKNPITKSAAIRMYTVLLFHTLLITILLYVFTKSENISFSIIKLAIFLGCFFGAILLSLAVSYFQFISKVFLNYLIYLIILGANVIGFICCARLNGDLFKLLKTMFIIFDAGSLTIIFFSTLVKDTPSTFWLMCSSCGGIIIAILVMAKVYNDSKIFRWVVILFGCIAFAIYESMNYNALDVYKKNTKNEASVPSMVSLPFELNICFVKIFWYVLKVIGYLCSMCFACCCAGPKKKK
jgi:hypothetical protein